MKPRTCQLHEERLSEKRSLFRLPLFFYIQEKQGSTFSEKSSPNKEKQSLF